MKFNEYSQCFAPSTAQALRLQQTTLGFLAHGSLDNRIALVYLLSKQGYVCTMAN